MYKKQMKLQKLICIAAIIASALVFVYALGLLTDLYDALYTTMPNPYDLTETDVPGSIIWGVRVEKTFISYLARETATLSLLQPPSRLRGPKFM